MKILLRQPEPERGVALTITLILMVLCGTVLGGYLVLTTYEEKAVSRSQTWNCALAYAEAGVDEALAQLNSGSGAWSDDGWGGSGGAYGPVTRTMQNGSYTAKIVVNGAVTTLYSTGSVNVASSSVKVSRAVAVKVGQTGLFPAAFAAVNSIQFNGNGIATDSYHSHNPNLSTDGLYDANKTSTNGNVASQQGLVNIGNHTINGSLYLGPTATYNSGVGQVLGDIYYDFNVMFPDVTLPTVNDSGNPISWSWPPVTTVGSGSSATHTITINSSGYYAISSFFNSIYPKAKIVVNPGVTATFNVTAPGFNISSVEIHGGTANSGTAKIYLNGPTSIGIAGNTAIDASNRPENLWYYGLPSLTAATFSGTSTFVGVVYAPQANFTLNGGGNEIGVVGSTVTGSITMNGHYNFHYDESLATNSSRGYLPLTWQEL